jgi:drug/metabolite transporter (DMT)-like permease
MSFEAVFSALAGWLILHQSLSDREIIGCLIMFAAVIIAQIKINEKSS